jgi:hypothetical protein
MGRGQPRTTARTLSPAASLFPDPKDRSLALTGRAVRRDCAPHRAHLLLRLGSVGFLLSLLSPLAVPGVLAAALGSR